MPNVDSGFKPPAPKPSPKKTGGTGASKSPAKAATTSRTTSVKAATTTPRATPTTQPVEPAEPKSEPTPTPTSTMEKRVVQPEGLEEYRKVQKQLSTPVEPQAVDRFGGSRDFDQEQKLAQQQQKTREDLLRQAAALETPLGRTVTPAEPRTPYNPALGGGPLRVDDTGAFAVDPLMGAQPVKGAGAEYSPGVNVPGGLVTPAPYYTAGKSVEYEVAPQTLLNQRASGSVLSPQEAPDKPVDPAEELSRLMEPVPAFYTGATAVQSPYSEETTRLAGGREVNVSIPVMLEHRTALADELEKPQTPEREAELRRDLERANAVLKQQEAYARALGGSGKYQPIEEQQRAAEKLMGTR